MGDVFYIAMFFVVMVFMIYGFMYGILWITAEVLRMRFFFLLLISGLVFAIFYFGLIRDVKSAPFDPSKEASMESVIRYYAKVWDFDNADLLIALAKTESSMNPKAINYEKDGHVSYGLLQVKCSTAKWLGMGRKVPCEMLLDVGINILFAGLYLKYLEKRYAGDLFSMISAYNAGTARKEKTKFLNQLYVDRVQFHLAQE